MSAATAPIPTTPISTPGTTPAPAAGRPSAGGPTSSMSAAQFDQLCQLVRREAAIVLEPGKEYLVESRLAPVARKLGLRNVGELVDQLVLRPTTELRATVIDAMTTNETSFFRDVHPWQALEREILPSIIQSRSATKRLRIWCAASSSGQEPYSLAMTLFEHFPAVVGSWDVKIVATDISAAMVERCRSGRFSQLEVNRGLPAALLMRWFQRDGAEWRIDDRLRRLLDVRSANLASPASFVTADRFDLVLMRNVLIYFDQATRSQIVGDVRRRLAHDGVLMLGSSEISVGPELGFDRRQSGKTIYFRPL